MQSTTARLEIRCGLAGLLVLLAGCAVGPDFSRPQVPQADRYTADAQPVQTAADGQSQHFGPVGGPATDWWRLFGSPQLDGVVDEALAGNPGLQAAQASLRQSQDSLRAGYGVFFPQAAGAAGAARERYSPQAMGQQGSPGIFNLFTLSASVSYALDVFGGERRAVEGLQAGVDLQQGALEAAYLSLTANVVNAVVAAGAYRAEIDSTRELIDALRQQVHLAEVQADAGTGPYAAVLSLRGQLATQQAGLPPLQQKLEQTGDLLATLAGHAPSEWKPPQVGLADLRLPADIPVSLPSELVGRRPDILVAEAQLHAASASVGVATAAMLPSIKLTGSYGAENGSSSQLFRGGSAVWGVAADLSTPLFEGGTLWYQRKAAVEAFRQSQANYRQTVLSAFAQVADSLHALDHDAETLAAQAAALDAAQQALRLVQANYQAGTAGYVQVLAADLQYRQAQIGYLQAKALRLQDTVALFAALGGGWDGHTAPALPVQGGG
ncbi:MAG: efflux transporter outer membrane subunit [Nevskia sp.]|nr:efflux transporter outer membrane subunit [Nevskia sp.]